MSYNFGLSDNDGGGVSDNGSVDSVDGVSHGSVDSVNGVSHGSVDGV